MLSGWRPRAASPRHHPSGAARGAPAQPAASGYLRIMRETLEAPGVAGLERSGSRPPVWVHLGAGGPGLERAEISLSAWAYQPHQHDTYGIGITLTGLQAFPYRGERWVCLPRQLHILHPCGTHAAAAAPRPRLRHRIVYLA